LRVLVFLRICERVILSCRRVLEYMEDAVEPREDLLGHLGHIAVVERKWLTVLRGLTGELMRSLNRVPQA
jgi:hypothetical protein